MASSSIWFGIGVFAMIIVIFVVIPGVVLVLSLQKETDELNKALEILKNSNSQKDRLWAAKTIGTMGREKVSELVDLNEVIRLVIEGFINAESLDETASMLAVLTRLGVKEEDLRTLDLPPGFVEDLRKASPGWFEETQPIQPAFSPTPPPKRM